MALKAFEAGKIHLSMFSSLTLKGINVYMEE